MAYDFNFYYAQRKIMTKKFKSTVEGEKINNWTVLSGTEIRNRTIHYKVKCECGHVCIKNASQLRKTIECFGCCRKRQTKQGGTRRTHGACSNSSDLYKTYQARYYMIRRCKGVTPKDKKNYLDRGIGVCNRWIESFDNFLKDMGKRPENSSLERIDNEKGYSPGNCKWASITEQNDNKRGCLYYTYNNEKLTIARWAEKWEITRSKAYEWLKREGIEWVINNLEKIKSCKHGMTNLEYTKLGFPNKRKGSGQRIHSASRDNTHPLHKMYKTWDYIKGSQYKMSPKWIDFLGFVEDLGQKPEGEKLKRYDTSKSFTKENCFWG